MMPSPATSVVKPPPTPGLSRHLTVQHKPFALKYSLHLLKVVQPVYDPGPLPPFSVVLQPLLQRLGCLGADHATVGRNTDPPQTKPLSHPMDQRQKTRRMSCVTGPHLAAQRPTIQIQRHPHHHLFEIESVGSRAERGTASAKLQTQTFRMPIFADLDLVLSLEGLFALITLCPFV